MFGQGPVNLRSCNLAHGSRAACCMSCMQEALLELLVACRACKKHYCYAPRFLGPPFALMFSVGCQFYFSFQLRIHTISQSSSSRAANRNSVSDSSHDEQQIGVFSSQETEETANQIQGVQSDDEHR